MEFAIRHGIEITHSTPYYTQVNGQTEGTHVNGMKPNQMYFVFGWLGKRASTRTTPYALTYGHDTVLPIEVTMQLLRATIQNQLTDDEYAQAMYMELEELDVVTRDA